MMDHQSRSTKVERRQVAVVTLGTTNMSIQTFSKTKTVNYYANTCILASNRFWDHLLTQCHSAASCQIQSPTTEIESINETRQSEFELDWQMSRRVTLLPVLTQTHS